MIFIDVLKFMMKSGFGKEWVPWGVREFCDRAGIHTSVYYRWVEGAQPQEKSLKLVESLFRLDPFFRQVLYQSARGGCKILMEELVKRRDILKAGMMTGGGSLLGGGVYQATHALFTPNDLENTRVALMAAIGRPAAVATTIDEWRELVAAYGRSWFVTKPGELLSVLHSDLEELQIQASYEHNEVHKRELFRVGALLSGLLAKELTDVEQSHLAHRWWGTAQQFAEASADEFARSWVCGSLGIELLYIQASPSSVLSLVHEVEKSGGVLHGELLGAKAQALSLIDRKDEARHAVRRMESMVEQIPRDIVNDSRSIFGFSEDRMRHTESYVYSHIGDIALARASQQRACALYGQKKPNQKALVNLHEALCLHHEGYSDEAFQLATKIVSDVSNKAAKGESARRGLFVHRMGCHVLGGAESRERKRPAAGELVEALTWLPGTMSPVDYT